MVVTLLYLIPCCYVEIWNVIHCSPNTGSGVANVMIDRLYRQWLPCMSSFLYAFMSCIKVQLPSAEYIHFTTSRVVLRIYLWRLYGSRNVSDLQPLIHLIIIRLVFIIKFAVREWPAELSVLGVIKLQVFAPACQVDSLRCDAPCSFIDRLKCFGGCLCLLLWQSWRWRQQIVP